MIPLDILEKTFYKEKFVKYVKIDKMEDDIVSLIVYVDKHITEQDDSYNKLLVYSQVCSEIFGKVVVFRLNVNRGLFEKFVVLFKKIFHRIIFII